MEMLIFAPPRINVVKMKEIAIQTMIAKQVLYAGLTTAQVIWALHPGWTVANVRLRAQFTKI